MRTPNIGEIYEGDAVRSMAEWPDSFFDHCITDPPYAMSKKKGLEWAFSSHVTMQEEWDIFTRDGYTDFTKQWLTEICRLVKPNGNIFVFGSYHNIYTIGFILQHELNRRIINSIIQCKPNAQPNITARTLTESTEQVIWVCNNTPDEATKWTFNYHVAKKIGNGKQLRNYWEIPYTSGREKRYGKHPAQKPEAIVERLVLIGTKPGDLILDCFAGTGTTGVVAERLGRRWIMIDREPTYNEIARKRLLEIRQQVKLNLQEV
jgi:site-specific DNA-methyltransferase (adenine-specific)